MLSIFANLDLASAILDWWRVLCVLKVARLYKLHLCECNATYCWVWGFVLSVSTRVQFAIVTTLLKNNIHWHHKSKRVGPRSNMARNGQLSSTRLPKQDRLLETKFIFMIRDCHTLFQAKECKKSQLKHAGTRKHCKLSSKHNFPTDFLHNNYPSIN